MGSASELTISLSGGGPWGFRLQGGNGAPLLVSKIRKKSKAHGAGVQEGDEVVTVNGKSVDGQTHMATMELVDSGEALQLGIKRGGASKQKAKPAAVKQASAVVQAPAQQTVIVQNSEQNGSQTGTYSETLLGREAKVVKEDRTVKEVRIDEQQITTNQTVIPVFKEAPAFQAPVAIAPVYQVPVSVAPVSVQPATNGSSLIDDALSKLETFPKVTDAFATSSETFEQASIANEQVTSNFPTETVTAELKENFKENIAPIKYTDYNSVSKAPPTIPNFQVKQLDVNKSVWQPASSSIGSRPQQFQPSPIGSRPQQYQQRGPSIIDYQKSKFQKQTPPPPKPKPKPNRQRVQGAPEPLRPVRQMQNYQPVQHKEHNLMVSPKPNRKLGHVFGPPVTISIDPTEDYDYPSSPDSSLISKKKLFSDSAFYDDPNAVYPTIGDQMKLCHIIADSLTSDANKRARGARMFAKRQKRAPKWIHEGMEISSSGDDVGHLDDLDSELSADDGGNKPLFTFKIPKVANQKTEAGKMSLSQNEFELLRLNKHRCEHKTVSPNTCFNLVSDLTSTKGRGAKLFEKRRAKAEEWVVDDSKIPKTAKPPPLNDMLNSPPKPLKSPWEAAMENPYGSVDAAFQHLTEYERMQLLNKNAMPLPELAPVPMHSQLPPGEQGNLLQGPNFNRTAKGWTPASDGTPSEDLGVDYARLAARKMSMTETQSTSRQQMPFRKTSVTEIHSTSRQQIPFRDYNPKPKAWRAQDTYSEPRSQQQQQHSYSHSTPASSIAYSQGGRWPNNQTSNSYSYSQESHVMGQPQYGYSQPQQSLYGTDL